MLICTSKPASSKSTKSVGSKRQMIASERCARLAFMRSDFVSMMTVYNSIAHTSLLLLHDSCVHRVVMVECGACAHGMPTSHQIVAYKAASTFKCLNGNDTRTTLWSLTPQPATNPSEHVGAHMGLKKLRERTCRVVSLKFRRDR